MGGSPVWQIGKLGILYGIACLLKKQVCSLGAILVTSINRGPSVLCSETVVHKRNREQRKMISQVILIMHIIQTPRVWGTLAKNWGF